LDCSCSLYSCLRVLWHHVSDAECVMCPAVMATNTTILYYENFRLPLNGMIDFSESIDSLMVFIQFIFFLVFLMLTCGYMLNCIASFYFRRPGKKNRPNWILLPPSIGLYWLLYCLTLYTSSIYNLSANKMTAKIESGSDTALTTFRTRVWVKVSLPPGVGAIYDVSSALNCEIWFGPFCLPGPLPFLSRTSRHSYHYHVCWSANHCSVWSEWNVVVFCKPAIGVQWLFPW